MSQRELEKEEFLGDYFEYRWSLVYFSHFFLFLLTARQLLPDLTMECKIRVK